MTFNFQVISKKQKQEEEKITEDECSMDCSDDSQINSGDEEMTEVYLPASPIRIQDSSDDSPPPVKKKRRVILDSDDEDRTPTVRFFNCICLQVIKILSVEKTKNPKESFGFY